LPKEIPEYLEAPDPDERRTLEKLKEAARASFAHDPERLAEYDEYLKEEDEKYKRVLRMLQACWDEVAQQRKAMGVDDSNITRPDFGL
jgi:hypothetical protein